MSTMTAARPAQPASRILDVVRMQFVNRRTYLWVPLIILGGTIAITLAVFAIVKGSGGNGVMYGGGAQAPLWYFGVVGMQSLTLTFPFSQAMSVTRREFYLGTLLTAILTSAILAVVFIIGGVVERATHGWGVNGWFFALPWVWQSGAGGGALFYFALALLFFVVGFWATTIYKRSGMLGLTSTLVGVAVLLVGALWVIGRLNAWAAVFGGLATAGPVILSLWMLALTALLAVIAYLLIRRMVP